MSDSGTPTHSSQNGSFRGGAGATKLKLSKQREIEVAEGDAAESHPTALCAQTDAASNTPNQPAPDSGTDTTSAPGTSASNGPHSGTSKALAAKVCAGAPAISISNLSSSTSASRVSASASNSACSISRSGTGTRTTSEYSEHSPSPSPASSSRHSPQPVDDDPQPQPQPQPQSRLQRSPPVLPAPVPVRQGTQDSGRCLISCARLKSLQSQEETASALSSECNCAGEPSDPSTRPKIDLSSQRDSSTETSSILDATGCDVDEFLRHAFLKHPKTRPVLLKIEEALNAFVTDPLAREHRFPHMSSYQRMLVHRMGALYGLEHNIDPSRKAVLVTKPTTSSYVARLPALSFKQMERLLLQEAPSPQLTTQRSTRSDTGAASSSAVGDNKLSPSSTRSISKCKAPKREGPASVQLSVSRQSSQQSQSLHASDRESVASSVRGTHQAESDSFRLQSGAGGRAHVESKVLEFASDQRARNRIFQIRTEPTNTSSTSSSVGGARVVLPPSSLLVGPGAAPAPARGPMPATRRLLTKEPNFYESMLSPLGVAIGPLAAAAASASAAGVGASGENVFLAQQLPGAQAYYYPQAQAAFLSPSGPLQLFAHPAAMPAASAAVSAPPPPVVPDQVVHSSIVHVTYKYNTVYEYSDAMRPL